MTITLVQHASNTGTFTSGTSGTVTATFGASTTAGNCLVACLSLGGAASAANMSVSPNTNGSTENWTLRGDYQNGLDTGYSYIYIDWDTGGGQTVINFPARWTSTASTSNSNFLVVDIYEVSGLLTASDPADQNNPGYTSSGTSWDSNNQYPGDQTTSPIEIWFAVNHSIAIATNTAATLTPPGSLWFNESQLSSSYQSGGTGTTHKLDVGHVSGYQIVSSEGTPDYAGTVSTSSASGTGWLTLAAPVAATTSTLLIASFPL